MKVVRGRVCGGVRGEAAGGYFIASSSKIVYREVAINTIQQ